MVLIHRHASGPQSSNFFTRIIAIAAPVADLAGFQRAFCTACLFAFSPWPSQVWKSL